MTNYSLKSCEEFISDYVTKWNGEAIILEEGCLGLGLILLTNAEGRPNHNYIIREFFINHWVSGHNVKRYNKDKIPKKYLKLMDPIEAIDLF